MDRLDNKPKTIKTLGIVFISILPIWIMLLVIAGITSSTIPLLFGIVFLIGWCAIGTKLAINMMAVICNNGRLYNNKMSQSLNYLLAPISIRNKLLRVLVCKPKDSDDDSNPIVLKENDDEKVDKTIDDKLKDKIEKIKEMYQEDILSEEEAISKINKLLNDATVGG